MVAVKAALAQHAPGVAVLELATPAAADGGDTLSFTARGKRFLFAGRSTRTNSAAHTQWQTLCAAHGVEFGVVTVGESALHLKSLVTFLGDDCGFVAVNNADGHAAVAQILARVGAHSVHFVADLLAANCLRVSDTGLLFV